MLKLKLFGAFSISAGDQTLSLENCRSPRVLRALLYILANRKRRIPLREFSLFLREGKDYSASVPYSAGSDSLVKTTLHRIRALLDPLTACEPALCLHCQDGGIFLDPSLTVDADTDRFNALAEALMEEEDGRPLSARNPHRALFLFRSLLALYDGRYLEEFSHEECFLLERKRYHAFFTSLCEDNLPLFLSEKAYDELILITGNALRIDPYFESLHFYKIRATLEKGDVEAAMAQYRMAERLFFDKFRINPSQRMRRLRDAMLLDSRADNALAALSTLIAVPPRGTMSWEAFSYLLRDPAMQDYFFTLITLKKNGDQEPAPFPEGLLSCRMGRLQYALLTREERLPETLSAREDILSFETLPLSAVLHKIIRESTT